MKGVEVAFIILYHNAKGPNIFYHQGCASKPLKVITKDSATHFRKVWLHKECPDISFRNATWFAPHFLLVFMSCYALDLTVPKGIPILCKQNRFCRGSMLGLKQRNIYEIECIFSFKY